MAPTAVKTPATTPPTHQAAKASNAPAAASSSGPSLRARLGNLPRETRDTLFMLGVIAWTLAPHTLRLSPAIAVLCGLVLAWRAGLAWRQAALPGRWVVMAVLALACGLTWLSEHSFTGRDASVTLLVVLMALKTLELRARRDALVVFFLGFFLVLTQFLYSQNLLTALTMSLSVWGWLTALSLAHMPAGRPSLASAGWIALRAAAVGTPVMIALFVLFPRIGPLWSMPGDQGRSGLSDQLALGDVSELVRDESIALRVRFPAGRPAPQQLYFRGPVLTDYDGQHWRSSPMLPYISRSVEITTPAQTQSVDYEMTLEPLRLSWLPLLEFTLQAPSGLPDGTRWPQTMDAQGQWHLRDPLGQRIRIQARAQFGLQTDLHLFADDRQEALRLPTATHLRTQAWARELLQRPELKNASASQYAQAILAHIRQAGFRYTLTPGSDANTDPVDSFWLDRRSGFCEHYAASSVIILRTLGVPARIVTGYQGTDPQPVDGYYVVRQSHAHAWAEYWQAGSGWIRLDPTAAVSPNRVDNSLALAPPPGLLLGMVSNVNPDVLPQLRHWAEALDNRWNQWVMGYGSQQQQQMLDKLGLDSSDLWSLGQALAGLVGLSAVLGMAWAWWDGRQRSPWARLQSLILRTLLRLDVSAQAQHTPAQLAQLLRQRHGPAAQTLAALLLELEALRYARAPDAQTASTLAAWRPRFVSAAQALRSQKT